VIFSIDGIHVLPQRSWAPLGPDWRLRCELSWVPSMGQGRATLLGFLATGGGVLVHTRDDTSEVFFTDGQGVVGLVVKDAAFAKLGVTGGVL